MIDWFVKGLDVLLFDDSAMRLAVSDREGLAEGRCFALRLGASCRRRFPKGRCRLGVGNWNAFWVLVLVLQCVSPASSSEAEEPQDGLDYDEELVTVGSRAKPRAIADTAVPVDVFSEEEINSINSSDLVEVLSNIVPSFTVGREPISDGASFIRPTSMRGLDAHHTLVLLDGKRRHRSALMRLGGFGAHGPDVGSIPSIALRNVEVLRDGAAAQYGSDAISGVIDFKLRNDDEGIEARLRSGRYSAGDGAEITLEANVGFALGARGFLNVSAQVSDAAPTSRSDPYDIPIGTSGLTPLQATISMLSVGGVTYYGPDAFTYTYGDDGELLQVLLGSDGVPDDLDRRFAENFHLVGGGREFSRPVQIWGQPARRQALFVFNAASPLSDNAELYAFGNYSTKEQTGGFFYRRPGVSQLLPVRLRSGAIYDPRATLYPSGFTPQFTGEVVDHAVYAGIRGERARGFSYDLSVSVGVDRIDYLLENTLNPSLGPDTPTRFRPGNLVNNEMALNADFSRPLDMGLASPLNVAFGFERREEGYRIEAGDEASSAVGPFAQPDPFDFETSQAEVDADPDDDLVVVSCRIPGFETVGSPCPVGDPIHNALPVGSNGFPGYPSVFATDISRVSLAAYVDVQADLAEDWLVNAALRAEDYDDFGEVVIWKLASRYRLTDDVNLRGSVGTGFRAPTPGQTSTTNVSTRIDAEGIPRAEGIFPPTHPASELFGGTGLDPEHSHSWTLGVAVNPADGLSLTLDYYNIRLDDRIVLSSEFLIGEAEAERLAALGVPGANDISQVRFFNNDVDSANQGIDFVGIWSGDGPIGRTSVQAAFNLNRTDIVERGRFINAEAEHDIKNLTPRTRGTITARNTRGRLDVMLRARYFGEFRNALTASLEEIQTFGSEVMLDVELGWSVTPDGRTTVKVGAQNALDNYPDRGRFEVCCGRRYLSASQVPWQGALLYLQFMTSLF